jgi:hypothetical protein
MKKIKTLVGVVVAINCFSNNLKAQNNFNTNQALTAKQV